MLKHVSMAPTAGDLVIELPMIPSPAHSSEDILTYDVAIVGLGYVGLPTALSFTAAGRSVVGLEVSERRLEAINAGQVDVLDSDRERLLQAVADHSLTLTTSPEVLARAATVIICVPTPVDHHLVPDLGALAAACATVVEHACPGQTLLLTSTTYVGATRDLLAIPLAQRGLDVGEDIFVAFSPERINPGTDGFALEDVPRVVGGITDACTGRAVGALSAYAKSLHPVSTPEAAELTKLYENTFRAVNIALINELADVSGDLRVDIMEVIEAASTKPYGFMPFSPGPGVGGHCIPCDPHYLLWQLRRQRRGAPLIEQAMFSIAQRPRQVVHRIRELLADSGQGFRGARVLIVGVAYKPGVADVRESPFLEVIDRLAGAGAAVEYIDHLVPEIRLADGSVLGSSDDAPTCAFDLVVLGTLHPNVDYDWVVDQQNVLDTTYSFDRVPHRAFL
jgi:UDP-N-acetyl-D-glucosamine dehydrogenase